MFARRFVVSALLAVCPPLCAAAGGIDSAPVALADGWGVAGPAEAGLDPVALSNLVEKVDTGWIPNVHALLIEHEGRLVFERYWPGDDTSLTGPLGYVEHGPATRHDLRSVSKSVTSLLLGIALGESAEAALARPIAGFFPDREDLGNGMDAVTLHHVLTMTAGLEWNETIVPYSDDRNDFARLVAAGDPVGFTLAKTVRDPPGSRWNYNSGLTDLTAGIIENLTGKPLAGYAEEVLFDPLGITDYEWLRPPAWPPDGIPHASAGLRMRARDLAKIASLILHDGKWRGRQVVPVDWVRISTSRHVRGTRDYGYGYFWLPGTINDARTPVFGSPVIRASGYGNQAVFVLPDAGLAITVFAGNYDDNSPAVDTRLLGLVARALR